MSNEQVGVVFEAVIQEVCNSSHVDFEESGVDQQTLEELRKGWQSKLTSLDIAKFPWDPAPQPQPQPQQNPIPPPAVTVPSNAPHISPPPEHDVARQAPPNEQPTQPYPTAAQAPSVPAEPLPGDVAVKSEGPMASPGVSSGNAAPPSAAQRAADMLHQRYGAAAAQQVHQLQAQSQTGQPVPGQQRPQGDQDPTPKNQGQTQAQLQEQSQNKPHTQSQTQSSIGNSQLDGSGDPLEDWKAEVARRREAAQQAGAGGGHPLREHVKSSALLMEGGGLLAPFHERYSTTKAPKRKAPGSDEQGRLSELNFPPASSPSKRARGPAIYDGADDDGPSKEEDEDAINSDLDDPNDPLDDDPENDDSVGQVMLCTYDKVQRVKSKWKCTLRDGILTSGGKEYVFQKATGEFEWF